MANTSFSPSVYGAESALLDLADHYLEPGTYSTLKSGLFGYMTAAMAQVAAEGAYHRNLLYRENFLNTATLPRSVYNYAKVYDYQIAAATPASCRALIGLYLDEVRAAFGSETGIFSIPRGHTVYLGKTPFIVAGRVDLTLFGGTRVAAAYNAAEMDFPDATGATHVRTYIAPQVVDTTGTTRSVVYMEVRLHQAVRTAVEFQVVSSSTLETTFFRVAVPAGSQLAGFDVFYLGPGETSWRPLTAVFNETGDPPIEDFCYYSYTGDGAIEIYFVPVSGYFRPAFNSQLRVELVLTEGAVGNFQFSGTAVSAFPGQLSSMVVLSELLTHPSGGTDAENLLQVKKGIMRKILLRRNIVMESDLESYLSTAVERDRVNDSITTFIKRRDDVQTRLFSAFLLLKDATGHVVPTNTAPMDIELADLDARGWSVRPGSLIVYDRRAGIYRLLAAGEYPDRMISDPNSFVYCVPFLMSFRLYPFPRLVYYRLAAAIDSAVVTTPGDVIVTDSFLANSITVTRNAVYDAGYTIRIPIASTLDVAAIGARCLVRFRFLSTKGDDLGYVEAEVVQETNVFQAFVSTEDRFDDYSRMLLVDSLRSELTDGIIAQAPIDEEVRLVAELYYDNSDPNTAVRHVSRGGRTFQLVQSFETADPVRLYSSLERFVNSRMSVTEAGTFHCDGVPLVGAGYFLNPAAGEGVMKMLGVYHEAIREVFDYLHNNTAVDIKLYNSYGPSLEFNLDRINISLVLDVKVTGSRSEDLRQTIVAETVAFVVSCNDKDGSRFSMSNLMTHLETRIPQIAYVRFQSINGILLQNAQQLYARNVMEQNNKRVPEYLNVATLFQNSLAADPFSPDVTVNFI